MSSSKATHTRTVAAHAAGELVKPHCGYLRLSVDRDGRKIGYEVQRRGIQSWADRVGVVIAHWYRDRDVSAGQDEFRTKRLKPREAYEQMLKDVAAGMWGGIAAFRIDRLVRLAPDFEHCLTTVRRATNDTGYIVAVDPFPIDTRTAQGRAELRSAVNWATREIETMAERQQAHQKEKARIGGFHGGGPRPFGFEGPKKDNAGRYKNSGHIGVRHVKHEVELLREAARRLAWENAEWVDIVTEWNSATPPTLGATGKPWSTLALQRILTSARIVGLREYEEEGPDGLIVVKTTKAVWKPILDLETWTRLRARRKLVGRTGPKESYVLSGMLLCGRCDQALTGCRRHYTRQGQIQSVRTYRCKSTPDAKAKGSCGALSTLAEDPEDMAFDLVAWRLNKTPGLLEILTTQDTKQLGKLIEAQRVLRQCDDDFEEIAAREYDRDHPDGYLPPGPQRANARAAVARRRQEAQQIIDQVSRATNLPIPKSFDLAVLGVWLRSGITITQQRALLRVLFAEIRVMPVGRSGPRFDQDRIHFVWAGAVKAQCGSEQ